jgi:hypothetical protein
MILSNNVPQPNDYHFEDFTEEKYRYLMKLAKSKYNSISFLEYKNLGNSMLLRHDIDFSVHRAYKFAKIESEENIQSTFFLWMHSPFYNLFEEEIFDLIHKIIDLGHDIGLHFDAGFYELRNLKNEDIFDYLGYEKSILKHFFGKRVVAFSFHNPSDSILSEYRADCYLGMVNTYSEYIRTNYEYCSDSNGYWRFKRLQDVLKQPECNNIHILAHPEWWTPEVSSPRERISRCIVGRSRKQHEWYDNMLKTIGRLNVRK